MKIFRMVFGLLLSICMMVVYFFALGENSYNPPCGLEFGMEYDKAATISGFKKDDVSGAKYARAELIQKMGFDTRYLRSDGAFAVGNKEAKISCYFVNGQLKQIVYDISFDDFESKDAAERSLSEMDAVLSTKYGQGTKKTHSYSPLRTLSYIDTLWKTEATKVIEGKILTYLIPYNEGSLYIDNFISSETNSKRPRVYWYNEVAYTYYDFLFDEVSNVENDF